MSAETTSISLEASGTTATSAPAATSPSGTPQGAGLEELIRFLQPGVEYVVVERQGAGSIRSVPWTSVPTRASDTELFEREIGMRREQIHAVAEGEDGLVIAAIAADRDETVRSVVEESPWSGEAVTEEVGGLTLIRFGEDRDGTRRSLIRPIGQPGALAVGDGVLLWSTDPDDVVEAIEQTGPREVSADVVTVAELRPWSQLSSVPSQSVDDVAEQMCAVLCDEPVVARARAAATRFGNAVPYERLTLGRGADPSDVTLVFHHADEDSASVNALRLADIVWATVGPSGDESLVGGLRADRIERLGTLVVVELTELRMNVADGLLVSWTLVWDD